MRVFLTIVLLALTSTAHAAEDAVIFRVSDSGTIIFEHAFVDRANKIQIQRWNVSRGQSRLIKPEVLRALLDSKAKNGQWVNVR